MSFASEEAGPKYMWLKYSLEIIGNDHRLK